MEKLRKLNSLLVLCCGAGIIFQLPYIRNIFYIPVVEALNLTNAEFGMLSSFYASVSIVSYFVGGYIADRTSPKKLLVFSFIATGIVGIYFSSFPSYKELKLIFAAFGVTTILTYWSALIKTVRNLGTRDQQGRIFGFLEGGRGLVSAVTFFILLALFDGLGGGKFGLKWVIRVYSAISIIIGIAVLLVVKDEKYELMPEKSFLKHTKRMVSSPKCWLIGAIIFTAFCIYSMLSFLPPYMVTVYNMPKSISVKFGILRYASQFLGGIAGGLLADAIGSRIKAILIGYGLLIACLVVFLVSPTSSTLLFICICDFILLSIVVYAIKGIYFSVIDEANIEISQTGGVSGFVSCIGFLPDVFLHIIIGKWIDSGVAGYRYMFMLGIVMCLLGVVFALILYKMVATKPSIRKGIET